jgi:cell division protein FtsW
LKPYVSKKASAPRLGRVFESLGALIRTRRPAAPAEPEPAPAPAPARPAVETPPQAQVPFKPAAAAHKAVRLGIDVPLLLTIITLVIFGILMVYSASWDFSYGSTGSHTTVLKRQIVFMLLGVMVSAFFSMFNYHYFRRLAVPAMAVTILLLIAVQLIGDVRHGAVRTLIEGSGQPSELAKLVTIIYLAVWLYAKRDQLHDLNFGLVPLGVILGVVGGLIFVQPDLSALITIVALGGVLFFLAGGRLRQIVVIGALTLAVGYIVVQFNPTGDQRVANFIAGLKDPLKADYQVQRSLEAFVNGGAFGVGIGNSKVKLTGLPVPHTDSIFAVVGEETGIIGAIALVGLYALILWRGLKIARRAPDGLGSVLAAGITIWLVMEAFINMAVMVGLMPFAGNALPFISVGGTNLVLSLAAIGILLNISRLSEQEQTVKERTFSEVVDLRGRDRRRRVPRTYRPASAARQHGEQ